MGDPVIIFKDHWPIIIAIIGFVISIFVVLKGKIPFMEKRLDEVFEKVKNLEDKNLIGKDELFDRDNQFRFQTVPVCSEMREECQSQQRVFQTNFCKKLDSITFELKGIVNDADRKREETRYEITSMNKQVIELMTQMKTILARDRKEETADMVKMVVRQVIIEMDNKKGS
jgi:hypothetical protein